jgi:hypothetical protein
MDSLVTLRTYIYPHEVAATKGLLESEGIECFVKDEAIVSANPLLSNAVSGVKIQVRQSDLAHAEEILNNTQEVFQEETSTESINSDNKKACPFCHSTNVDKPRSSPQVFAISILLLGFPLPFMKKKSHCFDCGKEFKI